MALVKVVEDIKQATRARVRNASPERAQRATAAGPSRLPMAFGADVAYIRLPRHPAILTTNLLECRRRLHVIPNACFAIEAFRILAPVALYIFNEFDQCHEQDFDVAVDPVRRSL